MRQKRFRNRQPIIIRHDQQNKDRWLRTLDLAAFPVIEDFTIQLRPPDRLAGRKLDFVSPSSGLLASFPWWDHVDRDLRTWSIQQITLWDAGATLP